MATRQAQYLQIKQRLDSYNISTTFPLQTMPLLQTLLRLLDHQKGNNNTSALQRVNKSKFTTEQIQLTRDIVPKALRSQMSKILSQNNQLHLQVVTLKQQLQSLRHYLDKQVIEKSDNKGEAKNIIAFRNQRERELLEQLQVAKFRFNQLMDFVHQNDTLEKTYLKKLINHRKFIISEQGDQAFKNGKTFEDAQNEEHNLNHDLNSRVTFKAKRSSSKQKQSHSKVNKTPQQNHRTPVSHQTLEQKVRRLSQKLHNRENEIQRLHALITHDGLNLNKVLTHFAAQMQHKKHSQIQERLQFLQNQNSNLKQSIQKSKNTSGRYQALRDQVDKCHQLINDLKNQRKSIKRSMNENNFDLQKDKKEISRSLNVFNSKSVEMKTVKFSDDLAIQDLRKKVEFYERQIGVSKKQVEGSEKKSSRKTVKIKNLEQKVKEAKEQKEGKKGRQKYEGVVKLQNGESKGKVNTKGTLHKKTKQKVVKNKPIAQIPQQSQQQSIEQSSQQRNPSSSVQQHQEVNINKTQDIEQVRQEYVASQSEQQEGSSLQQVRNQTLIEQYEETIDELKARCFKQKEELESKSKAIKALQQIANRFLSKEKQSENSVSQINVNNEHNNQQLKHQISLLKSQVQQLQSLLNQSQFQKQQLRRQFIQMQQLYNRIPTHQEQQQQQQSHSIIEQNYKQKLQQLQLSITQKDKKISDMREDNLEIQDKLLKSLDRIRRLNDQIETLTSQKETLGNQLQKSQRRLQQAALTLHKQRETQSMTVQLNEIEKDQIILLRKNISLRDNRIANLQNQVKHLKEQNYILNKNEF